MKFEIKKLEISIIILYFKLSSSTNVEFKKHLYDNQK